MWRGWVLFVSCVLGCSDVSTYQPAGPSKLVVGGRAGYSLARNLGFDGCDPYSKPPLCAPDVNLGTPRLHSVTSDHPDVLEIVDLYLDLAGIAVAHAPGHATVTITSEDRIEHTIDVDVVAPTRIAIGSDACGMRPMPVGTQQCLELHAYDGDTELAGGALDAIVDTGALQPAVVDTTYAAQNTSCYTLPAQPGSTTLSMTLDGLTTSLPITYYDLPQIDAVTLRTDPATGPFKAFSTPILIRSLVLAGQPVCELDGSVPSKWTTTWTSETPDICLPGLYGDTSVAGQGTGAYVMSIAAGTCRMRVDVGTFSKTYDLEFFAMP